MYRNHPLYRNSGGMAHDERTIRNVDDEIYRIAPKTYDRGAVGRDARDEYGRDLREKRYLRHRMNRMANGGMPMMPPPPMGPPPGGPPPMGPPPMGGPPPSMGPPPMGGPPPLEGIEAAFAQQMSQKVDSAGNTEQLIDAIRGNDKPIQARYDELSQYVGQQDAHQTPETVLALVQPTFLMTEQGVMESGIEQLLQQIPPTGDPAMGGPPPMAPPPMGGPPPMGPPPMGPPPMGPPPMGPPPTDQGVGALLGPGMTPPPPPPQMMAAVGGAVKKLQEGGGDLKTWYEEDYQTIKDIMAPTKGQQRLARSQLFFDAARAGLNLAANRDSQGNPLRGSTASKFAAVTEPVLASVPKASEAALSAAGETAARQAAVGSALATRTAERAAAAAKERTQITADAQANRGLSADYKYAMNKAGEKREYNENNPAEVAQLRVFMASRPAEEEWVMGLTGFQVSGQGQTDETPLNVGRANRFWETYDESLMNAITSNLLTDEQVSRIEGNIVPYLSMVPHQVGDRTVYRVAGQVPPSIKRIIAENVTKFGETSKVKGIHELITTGFSSPGSTTALPLGASPLTPVIPEGGPTAGEIKEQVVNIPGMDPLLTAKLTEILELPEGDLTAFEQQYENFDLGELQGVTGWLKRGIEAGGGLVSFLEEVTTDEEQAARTGLTTLTEIMVAATMAARPGRDSNQEREDYRKLFPDISTLLSTSRRAMDDYNAINKTAQDEVRMKVGEIVALEKELRETPNMVPTVRAEKRASLERARTAVRGLTLGIYHLNNISNIFEAGLADKAGVSIPRAPRGAGRGNVNVNELIEQHVQGP